MILQVHDSDDAWLRAAVDLILSAQGDSGSPNLCLAGGSTPRPVYEALARSEAFRGALASKAVHLWVGDEREAPAHSGLRNSEMVAEIFAAAGFKNSAFREPEAETSFMRAPALRGQGVKEEQPGFFLHAWPQGPRESAAAVYEKELSECAGERKDAERTCFDLTILGMGEDGHTAGLFAEEDFRRGTDRAVLLTEAPQEPKKRMTMAPRLFLSSRKILVLTRGLSKARLLMANLFGERADPIKHFLLDNCEVVAQI